MRSMRQRAVQRAGVLLLTVLLLVPLALRGHRHEGDRASTSRPCATCVAALHSPAVSPVGSALASPLFQALALATTPAAAAARPERRPHSGRAPPTTLGVHTV